MEHRTSNMSINERVDLNNAKALKEAFETQKLLLQYVALMSDIEIPIEGGENDVSNIEEIEN